MRAKIAVFILVLVAIYAEPLEAETRTFRVSFSPPTTYTDGTSLSPADIKEHRFYISTVSYQNLQSSPTMIVTVPGTKHSFCVTVNNFDNEIYVAGVTVLNNLEESFLSPVAYRLRGNIYDRDNVATGKVDIADLQTLRQYWGNVITHPYYDCNTDFTIAPTTDQEEADVNRDGRVDFLDQVEVGLTYGNATK